MSLDFETWNISSYDPLPKGRMADGPAAAIPMRITRMDYKTGEELEKYICLISSDWQKVQQMGFDLQEQAEELARYEREEMRTSKNPHMTDEEIESFRADSKPAPALPPKKKTRKRKPKDQNTPTK